MVLFSLLVIQRLHFVFTVKALTLLCFAEFYHNRSLTHSLTLSLSLHIQHTHAHTRSLSSAISSRATPLNHTSHISYSLRHNPNVWCMVSKWYQIFVVDTLLKLDTLGGISGHPSCLIPPSPFWPSKNKTKTQFEHIFFSICVQMLSSLAQLYQATSTSGYNLY